MLNHWPLDRPLDKRELAASVGLGTTHMNRLFVASQSRTPRQYFDERRHEEARRELGRGVLTVKEIALRLGFASLQRFSTWFRLREGVSPRGYREVK